MLNEKIDILKERVELRSEQLKSEVSKKDSNKNKSNWSFASYESCFISKTMNKFRLILPTALIRLEIDGQIHGPFRVLLDTGAQPMLISYTLFKRLKCATSNATRRVLGLGSTPFTIKRKIDVIVRPWFDSSYYQFEEALVLPHQNSWSPILPSRELDVNSNAVAFRNTLADPEYHLPKEVHIIVGCGFVANILDRKIGHDKRGTALFSSHFGNVVMGEYCEGNDDENCVTATSIVDNEMAEKLNGMIEQLWKMDVIGNDTKRTEEQEMVEQHFLNKHRRDSTGRFIVYIPFKPKVNDIGSSRQVAMRRFMNTERKLKSEPQLKEFYISQMREEIRSGHMVEVDRPPKPGQICYHIPHHVASKDKKPRIVFDASCKTNRGISLNDVQMLGEKLQPDLHETVMRLRKFRYVVCGDIKRMFNQVRIDESQWDCQRIFWRENENELLREYWLTVVTFGLTASAYLAVRCVLQAAREASDSSPEAAKIIERDFYMDDCVTGAETEDRAIELANEIGNVLNGAGFKLAKWKSNSRKVLDALKQDEIDENDAMVFSEDGQTTILGLKWLFARDQYTFVVKTPSVEGKITKRKIVSCVAQLYDPNGYGGPVILHGKIIIQKAWIAKLDWDETVTEEIANEWIEYWKEIKFLEKFRIDRWIGTEESSRTKLIGFSDSSQMAYGAVIYARTERPDGSVKCTLLMSKSRVAPLKQMSIPRLELAGAELLARLIVEVKKSMEFEHLESILWTDSTSTLYWIRNEPANLKVYVANRVASIQQNTDLKCWRYVNTKDNPADLLSRGMKPSQLVCSKLWLHGPEWLALPEKDWPVDKFPLKIADGTETEMRVHTLTTFQSGLDIDQRNEADELIERIPLLEYADKLEKALRIGGYAVRYVNALNIKYKPPQRNTRSKDVVIAPPSRKEKAFAMEYFVKRTQMEYFNAELTALKNKKSISEKSKLIALNPRLDDHGVMRVGGRLDKAAVSYDIKHPVIIPKGSRLAWLLMDLAHRVNHHGGIQLMMQHIREKYWIPQLRDELKQYSRKCVECVRNKPLTEDQLMADLPADRVTPGYPFEVSGVDYAGPFQIKHTDKDGNVIVTVKAWTAVFVCMKTRAVHLDIVEDLTSSAFIACYERFVARRGPCYKLYSDNGTSFIGAEKEIARAYKEWQKDGTVDSIANRGTQWIFMTPAAPHQGGIYEAAVKSMKYHMKRIIGPRVMEYRQFQTLLCNIEAALNSRPLTPLTDDPDDLLALTPGHFLINRPFAAVPEFRYVNESNVEGKKLWIERQKMFKHFWERWHKEYLTTLQERKKWRREKENIKIGQLVIIRDENLPPTQWKMARIVELLPGKDGLVRNVLVKAKLGVVLKRPVQKLCILPVETP